MPRTLSQMASLSWKLLSARLSAWSPVVCLTTPWEDLGEEPIISAAWRFMNPARKPSFRDESSVFAPTGVKCRSSRCNRIKADATPSTPLGFASAFAVQRRERSALPKGPQDSSSRVVAKLVVAAQIEPPQPHAGRPLPARLTLPDAHDAAQSPERLRRQMCMISQTKPFEVSSAAGSRRHAHFNAPVISHRRRVAAFGCRRASRNRSLMASNGGGGEQRLLQHHQQALDPLVTETAVERDIPDVRR
eukprot:scaffold253_cov243-Pinguiococcus_pyrenoidosus.AAC.13